MKRKIIYVDMDDTLCDFMTEYRRGLITNPANQYPQSVYGFWEKLKPLKGAIAAINKLAEDHEVWILTKPSYMNPLCYTGKRVWVENHLGLEWCNRLILSPDKSLFKGDYLIDDMWHAGFEGYQIHFGTSNFLTWESVLRYFDETK